MIQDARLATEFYRKLDKLLNMPVGSVTGEQLLKSLANWDSLAILDFMMLADADYKSDVQPDGIAACESVDDLAQLTFAQSSLVTKR